MQDEDRLFCQSTVQYHRYKLSSGLQLYSPVDLKIAPEMAPAPIAFKESCLPRMASMEEFARL